MGLFNRDELVRLALVRVWREHRFEDYDRQKKHKHGNILHARQQSVLRARSQNKPPSSWNAFIAYSTTVDFLAAFAWFAGTVVRQNKSPDALNARRGLSVGSFEAARQSLRSIADALTNHHVLAKPVDPVGDDGSAVAVKLVTIVAGVAVRADVNAAGTDAKLYSVGRTCRSRSQHDQRGEREDTSLHLAPPPVGQKRHNA